MKESPEKDSVTKKPRYGEEKGIFVLWRNKGDTYIRPNADRCSCLPESTIPISMLCIAKPVSIREYVAKHFKSPHEE